MRRGLALSALGVLIWLPAPALGSGAFEDFGFDPRGVGMGGAQVATADDYTAAYFNPSLLVLQKQVSFGAGISYVQPQLDVHAQALADGHRLTAAEPSPDYAGYTLGVLFPLGGKVRNRLALGLGLYMPGNNLLRTHAIDPASPFWYRYQSSPDRIIVAASAGLRVTDWLSIGGGAQFLGALIGGFDFRVDLFSKEFEHRALYNDLELRTAPLAGATIDLASLGLRFGFGWRGPIQMNYSLPTVFDLSDVAKISILMEGVAHYSPHTFTMGAQYQTGPLTASVELRYALWSNAPSPYTQVSMDASGEVLEALGIDQSLDVFAGDGSPGFSDTLSPHAGLEYRITERFAVRAGYAFRPTPVPLQTDYSNILDGDVHSLSAGLGLDFDDPLEVFAHPIHVELAAQRMILPERRADKNTSDPVPSYVYDGALNHLTMAIRYVY